MGKSKSKKFRTKVVKGAQRSLPLKGLRTPKATEKRLKKHPDGMTRWNPKWGSPMVAVRLPDALAKAWNKHVGRGDRATALRTAIAKACGFNMKDLAKSEDE